MQKPTTRPRRRIGGIVAAIIIAACLILLLAKIASSGADYYNSVGEFRSHARTAGIRRCRVHGKVQPGTIRAEGGATLFSLAPAAGDALKDAPPLRVRCSGPLPATFAPGAEVVVAGDYDLQQDTILADRLLFKCPSKYESKREAAGP